jgi:hypothetical protein
VVLSEQSKDADTRAASVQALEVAVNGENTNGQETGLRHRVDALEACCAAMKLSMTSVAAAVTIAESGAVTTEIVQTGTFTWAMAGTSATISQTCGGSRGVWLDWSIAAAGTGYTVGTLIVVRDDDNTDIQFNPVLRITAVNVNTGAVTAFQTLTVGCANAVYATQRGPFNTFAGGTTPGSGLTVRSSGSTATLPANNAYYAYPTPPNNLLAPLQESAYRLKHIHIGTDLVLTVLELDPPPVPMQSIGGTSHQYLLVTAYQFQPPVKEYNNLAYLLEERTLAVRNAEAISLTDNTGCAASGQCFTTGNVGGSQASRNVVGFAQIRNTSPVGSEWHIHEYIELNYASVGATFNFGASDVQFTLIRPLQLYLPTS